jgi:hypothetical protein
LRRRDPTPLEIRAACLEIQAEWSAAERMVRAGLAANSDAANLLHWTPPAARLHGKGVA